MPAARYRSAESAEHVGAGGGCHDEIPGSVRPERGGHEGVRAKPLGPGGRTACVAGAPGASLESYYWMFGRYDGMAIIEKPDSQTMAALSLRVTSTGSSSRFESHELIEASDLAAIADRARGQLPGAW
jgi:GYD domain